MKKIIALLSLLSLAACSGGGGAAADIIPGSELPELTSGQQRRMSDFSQAQVDTQGATAEHNKRPDGRVAQTLLSMTKQVVSRELSQKGEDVAKQVSDAIDNNDCELTAVWPSEEPPSKGMSQPVTPFQVPGMNSAPPGSVEVEAFDTTIDVKIGSTKSTTCPIYSLFNMRMKGNMTQDQQSANGQFELSFQNRFMVHEWSTLYAEMDILGYSTGFTAKMNFNGNQGGFSVAASGTGDTQINSKTSFEGLVNLKTTMNVNGSGTNEENVQISMQIVSDYQFTDFRAVGVIRGHMQGQQQDMNLVYYINGDQVTEKEYMEFFSGSFTTDSANEISGGSQVGMSFPTAG